MIVSNNIIDIIYTFDSTYKQKYDLVMDKIPDKKLIGIQNYFNSLFSKTGYENVYIDDYSTKCYLVLEHIEVKKNVLRAIENYLFTFTAEFLQPRLKVNLSIKAINLILDLGYDANEVILELLINSDRFAEEAIDKYGIGDFLAIDGKQHVIAINDNIVYYAYLANHI